MTVSLCIRQESKRNDDSVSVEELDWSAEGVTQYCWQYSASNKHFIILNILIQIENSILIHCIIKLIQQMNQ